MDNIYSLEAPSKEAISYRRAIKQLYIDIGVCIAILIGFGIAPIVIAASGLIAFTMFGAFLFWTSHRIL